VVTSDHLPNCVFYTKHSAAAQNNLGNVLKSQGERVAGDEGARLLAESVAAYRAALLVYTSERSPHKWEVTQNNLGDTYYLLRDWIKVAEC
jgi:hypothetical protein